MAGSSVTDTLWIFDVAISVFVLICDFLVCLLGGIPVLTVSLWLATLSYTWADTWLLRNTHIREIIRCARHHPHVNG